jgi:hypothetical protein
MPPAPKAAHGQPLAQGFQHGQRMVVGLAGVDQHVGGAHEGQHGGVVHIRPEGHAVVAPLVAPATDDEALRPGHPGPDAREGLDPLPAALVGRLGAAVGGEEQQRPGPEPQAGPGLAPRGHAPGPGDAVGDDAHVQPGQGLAGHVRQPARGRGQHRAQPAQQFAPPGAGGPGLLEPPGAGVHAARAPLAATQGIGTPARQRPAVVQGQQRARPGVERAAQAGLPVRAGVQVQQRRAVGQGPGPGGQGRYAHLDSGLAPGGRRFGPGVRVSGNLGGRPRGVVLLIAQGRVGPGGQERLVQQPGHARGAPAQAQQGVLAHPGQRRRGGGNRRNSGPPPGGTAPKIPGP